MTKGETVSPEASDVIFAVEGRSLPQGFHLPLNEAVAEKLPWLRQIESSGLHLSKTVHGSPGAQSILLSPRTRLWLRVPTSNASAAKALENTVLLVAGHDLKTRDCWVKALEPHSTLICHALLIGELSEAKALKHIEKSLKSLKINGHIVCGKRGARMTADGPCETIAVMVHGLNAKDSLTLQSLGLGPHRLLGCGLFLAHKSAAAVGA